MAGELVPLVLIPRYTTYLGAFAFTTIGMEVTDYEKALVNVWRGPLSGTTPTFAVAFEESTDGVTWSTCTGGSGGDPGENTETQYTPSCNKRWFRIKVTLAGTNPGATCWALGFLQMRES
jgi:hypothetical protein